MADAQQESKGASILSYLRSTFSRDDESDAPVVDIQHIWQGLEPSSNPAVDSPNTVHSDAPAVDVQHIWQGLEPAA